ncbi:MAG: hypothetical protein DSY60_03150 [Persephonella sp.]|nr:MAG: hypothetical protein DSY60_03150 [Persephonella sp.]
MFYFSVFRTVFDIRDELHLDNIFIFYFMKEVEERFKRKICSYINGVCERCQLRNICMFPKNFLYEVWYGKPNFMITSPKYLNENLTEGKKLKIDFVMLNEAVDSFRLLEEAIKESCKEANFSNLIYEGVYNYNVFADSLEDIDFLSPFPKYRLQEFLELRSGVRKVKLKIFPSFLNLSVDFNNVSNDGIKFFLFKEIFNRVSEIFEEDIQFPNSIELNVKKLQWKRLNYEDFLLKKSVDKFKNYNFFSGEFIIEGNLSSIWYILEFIQTFGIGRLTNYGFGKVKLIKLI